MALEPLLPLLRDEPALLGVLGRANALLAVPEPARAFTVAGLATVSSRSPIVVCVPTGGDADRLSADLSTFLGPGEVAVFPAWETLPFERVSPSVETMGQRMSVLWHLQDPERAPKVVVASVRALVQRLGPGAIDAEPVIVGVGDEVDPHELVARLVANGYRREYQVEHRGEVALRGSIVDVFPSTSHVPVRIDLWGDEVDRLTEFSVADQRSTVDISEVTIFPARELLATAPVQERAEALVAKEPWGREQWERLANGLTFDGMESWLPWLSDEETVLLDLLDRSAQVLLFEPQRMRDRARDIGAEEADLAATLARTWGAIGEDEDATDRFPSLHVPFDRLLALTETPVWTITNTPHAPDVPTVSATGWNPVVGDGGALIAQLQKLLGEGYSVIAAADGIGSAERLDHLLQDHGVALNGTDPDSPKLLQAGGHLVIAPLERGFILPELKLAVLAERDLTGRRRTHRAARPRARATAGFFEDLKPGDYVVHFQHGVGKYTGMVKRSIGGVERDYLLLQYRGDDKLYIPSDQIDTIRQYTGGENPSLSRLGGSDWQKAKAKVRSVAQEIAQELVVLYQTRVNTSGHAFAADTPWQRELEDAFPYQETVDQLQAINEVKADMEADYPMDRLVCGDVGFGKTEVALRAVFKAVQDGKQAAVLVPTTLLAQQHFQTFSDRFAGFPIRVEVLSRFLTNAQAKRVAAGLASGEIDVVVGTHRLLAEELKFKNLGLLVVDEEQRFGVSHKERIKQLEVGVDVLTLTATPIPRTLEMSLTGIRDLTVINTPPAERQPILTYVGEYDDRAVAEAIRRELLREGQVFFVHNRVRDIDQVAEGLRELVPEARVAVAHGQMDEGTLEQVVIDFWEGEFDVLVCTTIIESGIDIPTVNTLVVDRADMLGLGQLHQLRGRVGRAGQRAYAYLFTPKDRELTEEAYERLKTIGEATELGSGFKIAMRDLEIRGAGNLLGTGQSGHIAAVGYDLYCQMVTEAVAELKGETIPEPAEIKIDVPLAASLPGDYVSKEELRLEAYRRLAVVTSRDEVEDIRSEWVDRYGPIPPPAENLLAVALLRAECGRVGIKELTVGKGTGFGGPKHMVRMSPLHLGVSQQMKFNRLFPGSIYKEEISQVQVGVKGGVDLVEAIILFLQTIVPEE